MAKAKNRKPSKKGKSRAARRDKPPHLPPVIIAEVIELNKHGEAIAIPADWRDERRRPPRIILDNEKGPAVGDSVLVKISVIDAHSYNGQVLKILPKRPSRTVVGVYQNTKRGGLLEPVNRKQRQEFFIAHGDEMGAESGDLVVADAIARARDKQLGLPCAKVMQNLGDMDNPKCYSMIAIFNQEIPVDFPTEAIAQAEAAVDPVPEGRTDLRDIPLVTIDGADARDFDDAVFAEPHGDGGWHVLVAIADVAHYVQPDSPLDKEGLNRGNSVYFPDRVVPMLPEALSNGLCSLNPDVDRYCLAVHLYIDAEGALTSHKFVRGIMRSHARLTYEQAQDIFDTKNGEMLPELSYLYGAYATLLQQRALRGAMDLDLPEYNIIMGEDGHVDKVEKRMRLDSHKLIEECMVTANIAAALTLEQKLLPGVYRVHEPPSEDKISDARTFLKSMGFSLNPTPVVKDFNKLIGKARGTPMEALLSGAILRSQMQAKYLPENLGHFGLGLTHYSHFTSPIRRYSDLITHRAICAHIAGEKKFVVGPKDEALAAMADHISTTERRAMVAEREARDRYITAFMADSGDAEFEAYITSVGNYGVFVTLANTGASGLIRMSDLGRDFYMYEEKLHCLMGRDTGQRFQLGQRLVVKLKQADIQLGSLSFRLISADEPPAMEFTSPPQKPRGQRNGGKDNKKFQKRRKKR
ncbi:MAG: ribonuclease R [Rickettsiales bacterium]|nr:ribonuclease R [Rickettsiales bacterium]